MPIYEYECRACGRCFEQLVLAATTPACPSCASPDLARLVSGFAVSSETTRESALQTARRKAAGNPARRDRLHAEAEDSREHLRDDYGVDVANTKPAR